MSVSLLTQWQRLTLNRELNLIQRKCPVSCFDLDLCIAVWAIRFEHSPCAHICFLNTDKEKHRLKKTIRERKKNVNAVPQLANYVRHVLSQYKHKQFYYHRKGGFFSANAAHICRAKNKTSMGLVKLSCTICSESTEAPFRLLQLQMHWSSLMVFICALCLLFYCC